MLGMLGINASEPIVAVVAILVGLIIVLTPILAPIVLIVWLVRGGRRDSALRKDEARMMQEIYQGLEKMDKRMAALETLVLDAEHKEKTDE